MVWDMRTHVVLPDELVREIDELVGPRKRSEFLEKAAQELIKRERHKWLLTNGAGILKGKTGYEHWETPEKTSEWIEALRRVDMERSAEIWRGREPLS
jgi:metal-responsive CopG/Arc/MetJ family transcriptional regulator